MDNEKQKQEVIEFLENTYTAFRYGLLDKYPLDRICRNEHLAKYKVMRLEAYDKRSERKNG